MPIAVASNGPTGTVQRALSRTELLTCFDAVITADDVERPKPAPDVYLEACRLLDVDPSDAVGLEDSVTGARAATAAGMFVVGVGMSRADRRAVDLVVRRLDDRDLLRLLGL